MNKLLSKIDKKRLFIILLLAIAAVLRFYNLNWDEHHYLHPDERLYVNASDLHIPSTINNFFQESSPLNPNMFYYGSFPLYLYKAFQVLMQNKYDILFVGRFLSAFFSTLTLVLIYKIGKKIYSEKAAFIAAFIFAFMPGSIQHAHFLTTESILVFLLSLCLHLSILLYKSFGYRLLFLISIVCGLSFSTKITGAVFSLLPITSLLPIVLKKNWKTLFLSIALFITIFITVGIIFAPYQLIDWVQFRSEQEYMQGVILGKNKPPFTIIYNSSPIYIYQLVRVMPFIFGFLTLPLALIGLMKILKKTLSNSRNYIYFLIVLFPLLYFAWSGSWFAKFSRYYILLIPFVALWSAYFISKLNKKLQFIFLLLIALNGILFIRIYSQQNTRLQATYWINNNIPPGSIIAGEHWDDSLPLPVNYQPVNYNLIQLNVYDPDTKSKISALSKSLFESDYVVLSSRRVYQSIINNPETYPYTNSFYKHLFNGSLGFKLIKSFTRYPFIFSDDFADESFQSYDHPPVYIYKNVKKLSQNQLERIIYE